MFGFGDYTQPPPPPAPPGNDAATVAAIQAHNATMMEHQRRQQRMSIALQMVNGVQGRAGNLGLDWFMSEPERAAFDAACRLLQREFDEGI